MRMWALFLAGLGLSAAALAHQSPPATPSAAAPMAPTLGQSYLPPDALPDARLFIGPPPAAGSAAEAQDIALSEAALAVIGGPRWVIAVQDADLFTPNVALGGFSCAAGVELSATTTPKTAALMQKSMATLGRSTAMVKAQYARPRPFMVNGRPTCTPDWEDKLRHDGSYPSGHSAIGYGWGLILAALLPQRAGLLVKRGIDFGDSRRFCNAHWDSDIRAGRTAGAAVVARLHADPAFANDLAAARRELTATTLPPPARDCTAEANILGAP